LVEGATIWSEGKRISASLKHASFEGYRPEEQGCKLYECIANNVK
jgi:hypothetical protein